MSADDRSTILTTGTAGRKPWATPIVIVESATRETLSTFNTLGPDDTTSGSPVGS